MIDAADIERAKNVPIDSVVTRRGFQLRRDGNDLAGPCPTCGGRDRFVITPKRNLWTCRQCEVGGDVIALVQRLDNVDFPQAVEILIGARPQQTVNVSIQNMRRRQQEQEAREAADSTAYALRWWNEGVCIWDTPAQAYLASRRFDGLFPPDRDAVFRFHPACVFGRGEQLPCLLALLRNVETDQPQAVHRTALTPDGHKIDRKMLGPKAGAAIKLWPQAAVTNRLVVGEGIETSLSAALHIRHRGSLLSPAWACVDAGNLETLPVIPSVQTLTILVDNDASGRGQKAAEACMQRWVSTGRKVVRLVPKVMGADFNDISIG